jgi:tRNA (cmo5U34)-methyltransferase
VGIGKKFDELADTYEVSIRKKIPQYDELQRVFFNLLPFQKDDEVRVLDLGLGTGETAEAFLRRYPNAKLVGVDASNKMIQMAQSKLANFVSRIELVQSDFRMLPSLGIFDFVYSILAIHHLPAEDKKSLFKRIWSMLKPKGCFLLMDVVRGPSDELTKRYVNLTFPFDSEDKPSSLMEHLQWLQEARFKIIEVPWKYYKLASITTFKG